MTARDVRNIRDSFIDLLRYAPGDKEDKQRFFRDRTKHRVTKSSYERMFDRLIDVAGRDGAGELVFDYVLERGDERLLDLLDQAWESGSAAARSDDKKIVQILFYKNGKPRRITEHLNRCRRTVTASATLTVSSDESVGDDREYEYDVALSFAGENREYVESVAKHLDDFGIEYFYDKSEETELWGKNLAPHLEKIYREKARFCVLFISEAYARKPWPQHEAEAALARQVEERGEYLLPVQMDDTSLDGLSPSIQYVDANRYGPAEVAEMIAEKIGH